MIGYISDNLLLPILDFFYGLVPSYGLAIVALTVVIRLALFPLSAGSIRSARRMRIAQPVMQATFSPLTGRLSDRVEPRVVASAGMGLGMGFAMANQMMGGMPFGQGAAGGAVQWMNRLWNLPEAAGLNMPAPGWT